MIGHDDKMMERHIWIGHGKCVQERVQGTAIGGEDNRGRAGVVAPHDLRENASALPRAEGQKIATGGAIIPMGQSARAALFCVRFQQPLTPAPAAR